MSLRFEFAGFVRIITLFIILHIIPVSLYAQLDLGIPSVTGKAGTTTLLKNYEAIGVNPSNLGWDDNKIFSMGLFYINVNAQSNALPIGEMLSSMINYNNEFSEYKKYKFSDLFYTKDGFNMNSNVNWAAFSIHAGRFGGIAFNLRDRITTHFSANKEFSDILFKGINSEFYLDSTIYNKKVSEVFNGTSIKFMHLREFNISYGVKIINIADMLAVYGGFGYRYIWGLGLVDINAENDYLNAYTSLRGSNYEINKGAIDNFSVNKAGNVFNAGGRGSAIDIGANVILLNKFKFGMSVLDIGSITWDKNSLKGINTNMKKLDSTYKGLNSFNVIDQIDYLFNKDGLMEFKEVNSFTTNLSSKFRAGAGIKVTRHFEIGVDMLVPLNQVNNYLDKSFFSFGAEVNILNIIKLNSGIAGNANIGWNVPLGVTISTGGLLEMYIATADILTWFDKTWNPQVSFAFCALRLNFPGRNK